MKPLPPVAPAFSRRYQAICFILFSVLPLLAPFVMPTVLPARSRYEAIPWGLGDYTFMREEIFDASGPIDVLFLGTSSVWAGINPGVVREALGRRLRHEPTVLNFGADFYGHESAYFLLRDTLERRRVRLVVLGVPSSGTFAPHVVTPYLVDVHRDATLLRSLPLAERPAYYAAAVLATPRQLLSLVRPNRGLLAFEQAKHEIGRAGGGQHYDTRDPDAPGPDTDEQAASHVDGAADALLSSDNPRIRRTASSPHQEIILRAIAALCAREGAQLVLVRVPLQDDDVRTVELPGSDFLDGTLRVIAPASQFLSGSPPERAPFYRNAGHLNYRGSVRFTGDLVPALLAAYDGRAH